MKLPLSTLDEMFILLDEPVRPLTIQLEARVSGRLDEDRVRAAIHQATHNHPLARARLLPWTADARTYEWAIEDELQIDPLTVMDADVAGPLDDVRSALYSRTISLFESPPFRALLVHAAGGDYLMLAINHVMCDGIGALRLLQSIGRAYAGVPDPPFAHDPAEAFRLALPSDGPGLGDRIESGRLGLQQLAQMRSRAAKVAAKDPSPDAGYTVHTRSISTRPLVASEIRKQAGATMNDVLLAAVHRCLGEWNGRQGKKTGRIALSMPVNARPESWRTEVVCNLIASESVSTTRGQRATPETCLSAVTEWTEAVKRRGPGEALAMQARGLGGPVGRRRAFGKVMKVTAGILGGTSAVSNLGLVPPDWVDSAEFDVTELWVSPPAVQTAIALGAISIADTIHLSFRASPASLSRAAVDEIADIVEQELHAFGRPI
jgi:NRPS condensation-like uncharacterized protein